MFPVIMIMESVALQGIITNNSQAEDKFLYLEIMDLEGQTEYTIFSPNKFSVGYSGYILWLLLVYSILFQRVHMSAFAQVPAHPYSDHEA